jgi:hypothetical protein
MNKNLRLAGALVLGIATLLLMTAISDAQPGGKKEKGGKGASETVDEFVAKMMGFNKAKDGKLTKQELTDTRLHELFDRADTKKQGYLTRADLEAICQKESLPSSGDFGKKKGKDGPAKEKK